MFSYLSPETRVRKDHPLRAIRSMVDEVLAQLSRRFDSMYASAGRPSIPPEKLLRAQLLQMLYSIRSERLLEEIDYSLLWRQQLNLHDLRPYRLTTSSADHLYKYFRCGLEHTLAIEWGGLRHRDEGIVTRQRSDGTYSYLFERTARGNEQSLGIIPRELVDDFYAAVQKFFESATSWNVGTQEHNNFNLRFEQIFLTCETPSP